MNPTHRPQAVDELLLQAPEGCGGRRSLGGRHPASQPPPPPPLLERPGQRRDGSPPSQLFNSLPRKVVFPDRRRPMGCEGSGGESNPVGGARSLGLSASARMQRAHPRRNSEATLRCGVDGSAHAPRERTRGEDPQHKLRRPRMLSWDGGRRQGWTEVNGAVQSELHLWNAVQTPVNPNID